MSDKETIVISQWKTLTVGVGMTALLLSGCQKTETTGTTTAETAPAAATAGPSGTAAAGPAGNASKPPFGFLDTPKEGATVAPASWAFGWALDDSGIAQITVSSETGVTSPVAMNQTFPGVAQTYPGFPNTERAGFGFPVPKVDPGLHTLTITLIANDGGRTEIRRQIRVR
ncbi:MAG: hypothetical protein LC796_10120 [Acidobacteria bacterium]|nr:hypothetical protein [Acidobacteriota bacterium]MCA1609653.1 hypothetical protein [Acidobacteriota bacterium]